MLLGTPLANAHTSAQVTAQEPLFFLDFQHHNLNRNRTESLRHLQGHLSFILLFEPECSWCIHQGHALLELQQQWSSTPSIAIAAIGVHGDKQRLKKTWRKMGITDNGYQIGGALQQQLGTLPATPITLILNHQGKIIEHLRGYVPVSQLLPLAQALL
ncbi:MAG: hypothetical protein R3Y10_01690 [Ferrimonas sp.]